ncbi:MAG: NAD(P)/FAD-dependent oxidoreductase [Microbacteriaceae bacterium]|nr:NAD(P)/FAD-dependent oxidoreductase [Microbacteriaceae bacterium]
MTVESGTRARDVVIVGGGHNGLAAAAYLAQAGLSVTVLERLDEVGGAAVSTQAFAGIDARLSRYSYLVSLLPEQIIRDLRLDIRLARRRYSSYTPRPGEDTGLLVDRVDSAASALGADAAGWLGLYEGTSRLARALFPTVTSPLLTRAEARRAVGDDDAWGAFIDRPVGETIQNALSDDLARGVALTDALIGTFAPNVDPSLAANKCFLYHVIGGGTGDWDVPIGGMGAVSGELRRAALRAGAELLTGAEATAINPDGSVRARIGDAEVGFQARWVLAGCSPQELARLLGDEPGVRGEGAQVKVNLLLRRLPRLRDARVDPRAAFGGTFHVNETWSQLDAAYETAAGGSIPAPLPLEIYCHSLTDPTILSEELQAAGAQTITVFGLHVPHRLSERPTYAGGIGADRYRAALQEEVLASLDSVLAEPIEELLLTDGDGRPAIETKTTIDLEHALRLPGGNIFHGPLAWPWAEDDEALDTPADRWGVATPYARILMCGSGARRGGAVSAIAGHNAAMAVLESL